MPAEAISVKDVLEKQSKKSPIKKENIFTKKFDLYCPYCDHLLSEEVINDKIRCLDCGQDLLW